MRGNDGRRGKIIVVSFLLCIVPARLCPAATATQVDAAIKKAVAYLYSIEHTDNWEIAKADPHGLASDGGYAEASHYGGYTAIATYALLAAGEDPKDNPKLDAAIKWLLKADLHGTYAVALRSQVWLLTPQSPARDAARDADARFLLDSVIQRGAHAGFYGYSFGRPGEQRSQQALPFGQGGPPSSWNYDLSNSQYGVLGVWALEQAGAVIPQEYWQAVDKSWKAAQEHDGGWKYRPNWPDGITATMTAAGVATLFITQDSIMRQRTWEPCVPDTPNNNIEDGLIWMSKHIAEALQTGNLYGMYGVERIAAASGRKYFGDTDWYGVGADYLIKNQQKDGSWSGKYGVEPDTSFGLLFLARGRAPIMFNKVQYVTLDAEKNKNDTAWNNRPRDAANIARWSGRQIESFFNWQIVNLSAPAEELHDAPILYFSGSERINLAPADVDKLRQFVQQGGMIVANADCNAMAFVNSFEKLALELTDRKYEFRTLPPNHVIFTNEEFRASHWRLHPHVQALSNGVRELVLILEGDPGRYWQVDTPKTRPEFFELASDIYLYATDRQNIFARGDPYIVNANGSSPRQTLKVARIKTDANWDPEPGGWVRLAAILHNERSTQLDVEPVKLGKGLLNSDYQVAHLTGTARLHFLPAQRQELKDFVDKGGTLIVDAAGGNPEFTFSAESELKEIFGPAAAKSLAEPLPMDSPVYSAGSHITAVAYRQFAQKTLMGLNKIPRLRGIPVAGGRIGVFLSSEDLSAGLVGEQVDGIIGYAPDSATALMTNMLLYAHGGAGPTAASDPGVSHVFNK
jgi:hypothetical protein